MSKLQKLRQAKDRIKKERERRKQKGARAQRNKEGGNDRRRRTIDRSKSSSSSDDDSAKRVYKNLVEAKKRCNEDTSNLSYDSVKKSMDKQRNRLRKKKGARNIDFKVVIKDGRAFLKPETK